jgi:hypothetical protein
MTTNLQTTATPTVEDRSTEFVAVQGGGETTSAAALLVTAYGLMWLVLMGFLLMTWRRQKHLEDKLATLGATVDKAAERDAPPA